MLEVNLGAGNGRSIAGHITNRGVFTVEAGVTLNINAAATAPAFRNGRRYGDEALPLGPDWGGPLFLSQYPFLSIDPRGLCDAYADYLKQNGFDVTVVDDKEFVARSVAAGVPEQGVGCHLAMIDGYAVSGLVPVEIINRLVQERPEITGITLPGMPANAPGMAPEKTGTLKVYAFGDAGISVYSDE